jgi:hypothetical protein
MFDRMHTSTADQNILFMYNVSIYTLVQISNGVKKRFGMDLDGYVVADPANAFQNLKARHNKKM